MADISKLEQQANLLMQNVSGWETSTLERIGKRIKKYGKLSLADVKSINNIATVKQDMDAITKELAKVTGYNISQIEQMYGELLEEQHLANQPLYDYRGKKFVPFAENRELQAIAKAYARTTAGNMVNLSQIGGSHLGFIDKNGKFKAIEKMYTEALDKAVMQVSTGATDFHTAMRDTIVEMGGSGIRISYPDSGITRRLDTAVRQSLLWGAKQASVEYNEMIGEELGCDGYEVDYHSNPRPSHEFMQGKQFVVGKARTINGIHFDSFDKAEQALNEYGCLHYKTPIICGISEPRYSEKELARLKEQDKKTYEIDGKQVTGYEATQMQRRLETAVRNEKSIKNMAQAEGNKKLVSDCNAKIKAYQTKYNEISEITGIQGDKKRMWVGKGGNPKDLEGVKIKPPIQKSATSVKGATPTQKTKLETQIGNHHSNQINGIINKSSEKVKKTYGKYSGEFELYDVNYKGKKAYFSATDKKIQLNLEEVSKGSSYKKPYETFFHETGHNIDNLMNEEFGTKEPLRYFSENYKNGIFGKTLKEEANEAIESFRKTIVVDENRIRENVEKMAKRGFIDNSEIEKEISEKISKGVDRVEAEKLFCEKIKSELSLIERADISDMFEAVMDKKNEYPFGIGHGHEYWKTTSYQAQPVEAFAEMFSSTVSNPDSLKQIKRFFPKSYEIFEEMLGVI